VYIQVLVRALMDKTAVLSPFVLAELLAIPNLETARCRGFAATAAAVEISQGF
jgi:hypothetical protein